MMGLLALQSIGIWYSDWPASGGWAQAQPIPQPSLTAKARKQTESGGPRGFDAAKRVNGRKRHIVTEHRRFTARRSGVFQTANVQDNHGAVPLLRWIGRMFPRLRHVFADRLYRGPKLLAALDDLGKWTIEIITRTHSVGAFPCQNHADGWWNTPSPGTGASVGSLKTSRRRSPARRPGSCLPASDCSPVAWQEPDMPMTYF